MINVKVLSVRFCWLVLFLLVILQSQAQTKNVIVHYSTADGLSDNRLYCMTKDSEGFLWFGTWSGLNRFDGHNFISFKSNPGDKSVLKNDRVIEIVDDKADFLWIRTYDNFVYRFSKKRQQFLSISDVLHGAIPDRIPFTKILIANKKQVWLQSDHQGLFLLTGLDGEKPSCSEFSTSAIPDRKLPSDAILNFCQDDYKNVWLATEKGISCLVRQIDGTYKTHIYNALKGTVCNSILSDGNSVWFGAADGRLLNYNYAAKRFSNYKLGAGSINDVHRSLIHHRIYCTTNNGTLVSMSPDGRQVTAFPITPDSALYSIYEDRKGVFWLEPEVSGIVRFDPQNGRAKHFIQENVTAHYQGPDDYKIYEDNKGVVWACLKRDGFGYYDNDKEAFSYFQNDPRNPYRKFTNIISASYYDAPNVLWISTYDGGIEKIVFQLNDFKQNFVVENSLYKRDNEVRGILTDSRNRLWVGTKAGRLSVMEHGKDISVALFANKPAAWASIYTIMEDHKGRFWLGTKNDGLYMAAPVLPDGSRYRLYHYLKDDKNPDALGTNTIYTLLQDHKGRIWAGSFGGGLILVNEENGQVKFKTLSNSFKNYPGENYSRVRHLQEDDKGIIWVGTTQGLLVFNPDKGTTDGYSFSIYRKIPGDISSLGGNDINYIYRDAANTMWLCTSSGGLNKAITTDPVRGIVFENYSTKNGLPSDFILDCIEDNHQNLWMATQNGVSELSLKTNRFLNFGIYDGLPLSAFEESSCTKLANGDIIFGSSSGYWSFKPGDVGAQKIKASLAFTNLQLNNKDIVPDTNSPLKNTINQTDKLVLNYDQNIIRINYCVLDYQSGEDDNYQYRLVGFDDKWSVNKGPGSATYTNLPPGSYTFEVRAQTEQRYASALHRSLEIKILPPPWKTWWAYTIYALLIAAVLVVIARVSFTMLKLRQRIAIEKRVADLKVNFFTQVSHELRTPLTLIVNPSEEILQHEKLTVAGTEQINVVLKNARRMVRLVNQLLDLRKVQSGKATLHISEVEMVSFIKGIIDYFKESIHSKHLTVDVVSDNTELVAWVDVEKIDIVVYNLLANAIKFSDDNAHIQVALTSGVGSGIFSIVVTDEGRGVPDAEINEIFKLYYEADNYADKHLKGTGIGLALSKELVELHEGRIYALHNKPHGLKVVIELKTGRAHFNDLNAHFIDLAVHRSEPVDNPLPLTDVVNDTTNMPLILLVEDNDDLRLFLASKLRRQYRVETAKDGVEGLSKARAVLPDLILSDIMMPNMNGIGLLDKIKNDPLTSHIPVILLTARFSVESQIEGLKYGADYYITKPFQMELLQTAMSNLILQRKKIFKTILTGKTQDPYWEGEPTPSGIISTLTPVVLGNVDQSTVLDKEAHVITTHDKEFLEKIVQIVEERLEDPDFNIDDVADSVIMSRSAFFKKFKSLTNMAPVEFVRETRLKKAQQMFDAGETNVTAVAFSVGFNNPKYFSTCFKTQFSRSPSEYIKRIKEGQG